jgi:nicotinamide riboside kinase
MPKERGQEVYALTGASATGKTTLFEKIRELNPNYSFAEEAARIFYQENDVPKLERSSFTNQARIQAQYLQELNVAVSKGKFVTITDSSPLSSVVYAMLGNNKETTEKLIANTTDSLSLYTLFLLLNPDDIDYHHDPADPIRTETEKERQQVHQNLLSILTSLGLPYEMISGTVEERINKINQLIRNG